MRRVLASVVVGAAALVGCSSESTMEGAEVPSAENAKSSVDPSLPDAPADTAGEAAAEDFPEPVCAYLGPDPRFGYMQVELSFVNPLGEVHDLEATYALLDGSGTRVFTGTAGGLDLQDIHFPSEGEQFRLLVDTREDPPSGLDPASSSCAILAIEQGTDIGGYQRATDADTCEVVAVDSPNGPDVTVSVSSPYSDTTDVQVWWALRGPDGVRFDTSTKVIDLVAAGETIRFSENSLTGPPPEWVSGDVTCEVVGFWDQGR